MPTPDLRSSLDPRADDLVDRLRAWLPLAPGQAVLRDDYLGFILGSPRAAMSRHGGPEHVTGSCFVFTPNLAQVLLCFHKKGRFWVQLGGHVEPADGSVVDTAFREAREECGIDDLVPVGGGILDLDRHALGGGFSCRTHWDVGFAAIARPESAPVASDESDDVAWWPVDALPENVPPLFARRLAGVLAELDHQQRPPMSVAPATL
ncbi:NUDIX hydrolase [Cryobacterium sp. N22]|uniref:NUDIX hydrolase n=1 Tax=Cryobacterium sp. N22 TaxID=2048290 RepID=UPI000CE2E955|nr:NUDIX domain-containing protein [Cryobacterium sp. N22]